MHSRRSVTVGLGAVTILVATALTGCTSMAGSGGGPSADPSESGAAKCHNLAYFSSDMSNPWLATMGDGAKAHADSLGVDMTLYDAEASLQAQIAHVQQAIADGVTGMLLDAVEPDGVVPVVQQATAAGIPVITLNAELGEGAEVLTFIGTDHYDYGVGLAELALKAIPDGGNVAIIQGIVGNPAEVLRTEAINDVLGKRDDVTIVATVTDNWNNAENLAAVQDLLTKYPEGDLDVVIAEGPEIYVGAQYARSIGRDDVAFIAGDFPIQVRDGIKAGEIFGAVLQDGPTQGIAGVDAICAWTAGDKDSVPRPSFLVELPLVTAENVDQYTTDWNW